MDSSTAMMMAKMVRVIQTITDEEVNSNHELQTVLFEKIAMARTDPRNEPDHAHGLAAKAMVFLKQYAEASHEQYAWDDKFVQEVCALCERVPSEKRNEDARFQQCVREVPVTDVMRAGAGSWHAMHHQAAEVSTLDELKFVIRCIRRYQMYFYCGECQKHFGEYLQQYPPEKLLEQPLLKKMKRGGDDDGDEEIEFSAIFEYTVDFHNAVTTRRMARYEEMGMHKAAALLKTFTMAEAYDRYYGEPVDMCHEKCGSV